MCVCVWFVTRVMRMIIHDVTIGRSGVKPAEKYGLPFQCG